ncbi:hypothetical protein Tco_1161682, partial [Tanacetum coccineum]
MNVTMPSLYGCDAWYLDDDTIIGKTLVVGEVLKVIMEDGPRRGLHLNVDKTKVFLAKGGPEKQLVMKRVAKSIELIDVVTKINDSRCELLLLRACAGISKLYFSMHTCYPHVFERAQRSFDVALRSALDRIVSASGPGFGDWQWRLSTLPLHLGGLIDLLSNPSELAAPKLMKKLADIYFTPCSKVFVEDIYGDHAISCASIVGIKHRHNLVRDTLVDIYFWSDISAEGLIYVFLPAHSLILAFSFSSFGELKSDTATTLKRIRKFSVTQDIGVRTTVHIFSRISFAIAKGVRAQIVSLLPSNLLLGMVDFVQGRAVIEAAQCKCTCSSQVFEPAQRSFDAALRSALERIVTASGPGFGDWQWRIATLPFAFKGLGVYSAGDVLNYAFLASRLQSGSLQTKMLRYSGIVTPGLAFEDALCGFNLKMEIDLLSNPTEIAVPKLMKKLADIYFTRV